MISFEVFVFFTIQGMMTVSALYPKPFYIEKDLFDYRSCPHADADCGFRTV